MTNAQHGRNGPGDLGSRPRRGFGGAGESQVLYEDEAIRVISVSIAPGAIEKPHHHCLPAVFVVDRLVRVRDFNGATGEEIPLPIPKDAPLPITVKFLPQPLHYVENLDTRPFHATRIEFKHGFPTGS